MLHNKDAHSTLLKAIAIGIICLFIVNDIAFALDLENHATDSALAPTSRFNPVVQILWDKENKKYIISEDKQEKEKLIGGFQEDIGFIYLSHLIAQALVLKLSPKDLTNLILKSQILLRILVLKENRFLWGSVHDRDGSFYLPYYSKDTGERLLLKYSIIPDIQSSDYSLVSIINGQKIGFQVIRPNSVRGTLTTVYLIHSFPTSVITEIFMKLARERNVSVRVYPEQFDEKKSPDAPFLFTGQPAGAKLKVIISSDSFTDDELYKIMEALQELFTTSNLGGAKDPSQFLTSIGKRLDLITNKSGQYSPFFPIGRRDAVETMDPPFASMPLSSSRKLSLYYFGGKQTDGRASMNEILGKKGANLAEMTLLGLPVPPGFTIANKFVKSYSDETSKLSPAVEKLVIDGVVEIENRTEPVLGKLKRFGDAESPLFLSVRSGAAESAPGEYKTITKVGLHRTTLDAYAREIGDTCQAYFDYIRFMADYAFDVMENGNICGELENIITSATFIKTYYKGGYDTLSDVASIEELRIMVDRAEAVFKQKAERAFPEPHQQLIEATRAVIKSCYQVRGAACNVQAYVFGNVHDGKSGSGVIFTRNPLNGEKGIYGSFLLNAEGSNIVGSFGSQNRGSLQHDWDMPKGIDILRKNLPETYSQLEKYARLLETHFREVQDIEFTVQNGRLFFLQTRGNERFTTPLARVRILLDFVKEGLITEASAIKRLQHGYTEDAVGATSSESLAHLWWLKSYLETPVLCKDFSRRPIASGVIILPGIVNAPIQTDWERDTGSDGIVVVEQVVEYADYRTFSPYLLMHRGVGAISRDGNFSDHIAVRMRGAERVIPYLTSVDLKISKSGKSVIFKDTKTRVKSGSKVILDGNNGHIYRGKLLPSDLADSEITKVNKGSMRRDQSELYPYYEMLLKWIILLEINNILVKNRIEKGEVAEIGFFLKEEELLSMFKGTDVLERLASSLIGSEPSVSQFKQRLRKAISGVKEQCQSEEDVKRNFVPELQKTLLQIAPLSERMQRLITMDTKEIPPKTEIGEKPCKLLKMAQAGLNVPPFFVIATNGSGEIIVTDELRSLFGGLKKPAIVRSAHKAEGVAHSFSGVFDSYKGISVIEPTSTEIISDEQEEYWDQGPRPESLQSAYKLILEGATEGYRAKKYLEAHKITDFNPKEMNAVVMEEIDMDVFGMFITSNQNNPDEVLIHYQLIDKNAEEQQRQGPEDRFLSSRKELGGVITYNKKTHELGQNDLDEQTRGTLKQFGEVAGQIEKMFGVQQIELGASKGKVYVFQSRDIDLTKPEDTPRLAHYETMSEELNAIGYGYYHLPVLIIDSLDEVNPEFKKSKKYQDLASQFQSSADNPEAHINALHALNDAVDAERERYQKEMLGLQQKYPEYVLVIKDASDVIWKPHGKGIGQISYDFINQLALKAKVVIRNRNQNAIRHGDWENVELGAITVIPPEASGWGCFTDHFIWSREPNERRSDMRFTRPSAKNSNVSLQEAGKIATGDYLNVLSNVDGVFVWSGNPLSSLSSGARSSATGATGALKVLPQEWIKNDLKVAEFTAELSQLLRIENVLDQDKSTFIFSEKVTFDNGLGVLLPKLAKSGMRVAVIATNDRQRALIDELNQGKPENERIIYADTVADIRTKVHTARYYYFKVTGDPDTDLQGITTFDITEIVKKIIDALGKISGIVERERIELLHEAARKFAEAA